MINFTTEDILHNRDIVMISGQSNSNYQSVPLSTWPQREQLDRSVGYFCTSFGSWRVLADSLRYVSPYGFLGHSIAANMRYAGLRPSLIHRSQGGVSSAYLLTQFTDSWASWFASCLAGQIQPRSVNFVYSQGEDEALSGAYATWKSNVNGIVALLRSTTNITNLHTIIVGLPIYRGINGSILPYNMQEIDAQKSFVAGDAHSSFIQVASVNTVDEIHNDQPSLNEQAKLIVNDIVSRL